VRPVDLRPSGLAPAALPLLSRRRSRRARRPLSTAALVVYAVGLALGLGIGSAYLALSGEYPLGAVRVGPWTAWPRVGSAEADPYARSIVTRRGDIPLATGEGLALIASEDSQGRPLDAACTYEIGSVTPQARLWTLTVYDDRGTLVSSELERSSFTSAEIVRNPEGKFTIVLSRDVQPGNWLRLPAAGAFTVALRLYDTPATLGSSALDPRAVPGIDRKECGA
jgi:hypothetical protein